MLDVNGIECSLLDAKNRFLGYQIVAIKGYCKKDFHFDGAAIQRAHRFVCVLSFEVDPLNRTKSRIFFERCIEACQSIFVIDCCSIGERLLLEIWRIMLPSSCVALCPCAHAPSMDFERNSQDATRCVRFVILSPL